MKLQIKLMKDVKLELRFLKYKENEKYISMNFRWINVDEMKTIDGFNNYCNEVCERDILCFSGFCDSAILR